MRIGQNRCAIRDRRRAELKRALHRDRLPRPIGEHPRHRVGQRIRVAAVAGPPPGVGHPARRAYRVRLTSFRPDRGVEQILAAVRDPRIGAGRRQIGRLHSRERPVELRIISRDVDDGDVAREKVHDVSAGVVRVQDDAARVVSANRVVGIGQVDCRIAQAV